MRLSLAAVALAAVVATGCEQKPKAKPVASPPAAKAGEITVPRGGRALTPLGAAPGRRVQGTWCYDGREARDVAGEAALELGAAGWPDVVARPHPTIAGRHELSAARGGRMLTGWIDTRDGCAGVTLSIGVIQVDPGARQDRGVMAPRVPLRHQDVEKDP